MFNYQELQGIKQKAQFEQTGKVSKPDTTRMLELSDHGFKTVC